MQHPQQNDKQEIANHVAGWVTLYLFQILQVPLDLANKAGATAGLSAAYAMERSLVESMRGRV